KKYLIRNDFLIFTLRRRTKLLLRILMTKCYAVARGHSVGIFYDWPTVEASVTGYPGAVWKPFYSAKEAEAFLHPLIRPPKGKDPGKFGGPEWTGTLQGSKIPLLPLIGETMVYTVGLSLNQEGTYGVVLLPPNGE